MTIIKAVMLHCTAGGADKIYKIEMLEGADGCLVNYANGRRGSTMTGGTKTAKPVTQLAAAKIFDKLMREKIAKGYVVIDGGDQAATALVGDRQARAVDFAPMLCNPIEADEMERLVSEPAWAWVAQRKFDGERRGVIVAGGDVTGANRRGLSVPLPAPVVEAARSLAEGYGGDMILDGEMLGDQFVAFDILRLNGDDLRSSPLVDRLNMLNLILRFSNASAIVMAETSLTAADKAALVVRERAAQREGVVFKRADARYEAGRPASGGVWLKHKFVATLSALVGWHNNGKRSVQLTLIENGAPLDVGSVTIPANHEIPPVGAIVEVRYLYAYPGGSLFQPVYLGERKDLTREACRADQRKFVADKAA